MLTPNSEYGAQELVSIAMKQMKERGEKITFYGLQIELDTLLRTVTPEGTELEITHNEKCVVFDLKGGSERAPVRIELKKKSRLNSIRSVSPTTTDNTSITVTVQNKRKPTMKPVPSM